MTVGNVAPGAAPPEVSSRRHLARSHAARCALAARAAARRQQADSWTFAAGDSAPRFRGSLI
jgi:hypothetical protein